MRPLKNLPLVAICLSFAVQATHAADGTWSATTPGTWSNTANWSGGIIADGSGFTATFANDITADLAVSVDATHTLTNVVFGDADPLTAGGWTLSGSTITLASPTPTVTVNALGTGKTAAISSILAGADGLIKSGTGTLSLSAANTFTGGTTISSGAINWSNVNALSTGTVTLNDASTGSANASLIGTVNGTFTRAITIANLGTGTATIGTTNAALGQINYTGTVTANRAVTLQSGAVDRTDFSGDITGTGEITISSSAANSRILFVGTAKTSTGTITVLNGAILQLGQGTPAANQIADTVDVTVNGTGILKFATGGGTAETIDGLSGDGVVRQHEGVGGTFALTIGGGNNPSSNFSGTILNGGGTLSLTKAGTGTQILSGAAANTYTGLTTVSGGQLTIDKNDGIQAIGAGGLLISGSSKVVLTPVRSNRISDSAPITLDGSGASIEIQNNLSESVGVVTVKNGATVRVGSDAGAAAANFRSTNITTDGAANFVLGNAGMTGVPSLIFLSTASFTTTGTGAVAISSVSPTVANVDLNGAIRTFNIGADSPVTIAPKVIGNPSSGITKTGMGTLTLNGANTYTGATTVDAGTLVLGAASIDNSARVNINGVGVLTLSHNTTDVVGTLYIDGVQKLSGKWGRTGSIAALGADYETPSITGDGLLSVTTGPPAYELWAIQTTLTANGVGGKDQDPDEDGLNNLGEFAFDGDPLTGSASGKTVVKIATIGTDEVLTLTLPVRAGATFGGADALTAVRDGVTYLIQGSTDLSTWTLDLDEVIGTTAEEIQDSLDLPGLTDAGWTYRTFRAPGPVGGKQFLRAKVSAP